MEKPIRYSYRIQYDTRDALNEIDRNRWGQPRFWVERSSVIGSVLDYEWFTVGTEKDHDGYDPDWGRYSMSTHSTTYYDTSGEAEEFILSEIEAYPGRLKAYEEWAASEESRRDEEAAAADLAAAIRKKFESDNKIGKVFS